MTSQLMIFKKVWLDPEVNLYYCDWSIGKEKYLRLQFHVSSGITKQQLETRAKEVASQVANYDESDNALIRRIMYKYPAKHCVPCEPG